MRHTDYGRKISSTSGLREIGFVVDQRKSRRATSLLDDESGSRNEPSARTSSDSDETQSVGASSRFCFASIVPTIERKTRAKVFIERDNFGNCEILECVSCILVI